MVFHILSKFSLKFGNIVIWWAQEKIHYTTDFPFQKNKSKLNVCLVSVFFLIFYLQKQFYIFETKKFVRQPKMDRKQNLFSKLNL